MQRTKKTFFNEELYQEIAEELNIDIEEVREVYGAQSSLLKRAFMRNGFESVTFPYLGKFKATRKQVYKASRGGK